MSNNNQEQQTVANKEQFKKTSNGKVEWDLLPIELMEDTVKVFMHGRDKYGFENWKLGDARHFIGALMRHLVELSKGRWKDKDSGLSHLDHIIANALIIKWLNKKRK